MEANLYREMKERSLPGLSGSATERPKIEHLTPNPDGGTLLMSCTFL